MILIFADQTCPCMVSMQRSSMIEMTKRVPAEPMGYSQSPSRLSDNFDSLIRCSKRVLRFMISVFGYVSTTLVSRRSIEAPTGVHSIPYGIIYILSY